MPDNEMRHLASVLFTDVEGYSAMTQKDEKLAMSVVKKFRECVSETTQSFGGKLVHFYGDGSLSLFESALSAVECAIKLQSLLQEEPSVPVRIGIHLGEVVEREGSVFGNTVNIASRLQDMGIPGSILISSQVVTQISNHPEIPTTFISTENVKNIAEPVDVHAVTLDGIEVPSASEIRKRNKNRPKGTSRVILILVLALIAFAIYEEFFTRGNPFEDGRVVVTHFENLTGRPELEYIGKMAALHISRSLQSTEDAKIVSYENIVRQFPTQRMEAIPMRSFLRSVQAEKVISGNYALQNDSTLEFSTILRDVKDMDEVTYFPEESAAISSYLDAIRKIADRLAGYWLSEGEEMLTIPLQDAYKAYLQALELWGEDYDQALGLLERAIAIDSSFIDAYFLLYDGYYNNYDYISADSVLIRFNETFKRESLTPGQLRTYRYYEALNNGENETAYRQKMTEYRSDPQDLYVNTTAALMALEYVNQPEEALEILGQISYDSIDFEQWHFFRDRISHAVEASFKLGYFEEAADYAQYFLKDETKIQYLNFIARSLAGVRDTLGLNRFLRRVKVNIDNTTHMGVLYQLCLDLQILGETELFESYGNALLSTYPAKRNPIMIARVLQDMDSIKKAAPVVRMAYRIAPDYSYVLQLMGRQFALEGKPDSARFIIQRFEELRPERFDYGQTDYEQAVLFTILGDTETALFKLQKAVDEGAWFHGKAFDNDPLLMPLFDMPEYERVTDPLDG